MGKLLKCRFNKGFTLLEVMIAFAILAGALVVLLGTTANSSQQAVFAYDLTQASLLAKSKMTDIEYKLMDEGFQDGETSDSGTFRDVGHPDFKWEVTITPVEIPDGVKEKILAQVNSQLFGNESEGALQGNSAFSAMLPLLIGQLPDMINQIGKKVRRINLVITFPFTFGERTLKLTEFVVDSKTGAFNLYSDVAKSKDSN